jgi:DNA topoisomerase-2
MAAPKIKIATTSSTDAKLAQQYQQKTDKQHILDNPDTYIGSVENVDANMWVYDDATGRVVLKEIEYIPGLYKLFDEGIVNARDHVVRMIQSNSIDKKFVTFIDTTIAEDGTITITNDGNGIDVAKHPENNLWIPEMVFGHLRTSTNYNKDEKKIVGGKNGFGFKLVLIWSEYGKIETVDHVRGLKYVQEFKRNLDEICPPVITKLTGAAKPYTKVTFKPDYRRLHTNGLTPDMLAILKKRVYDIGAVTDHSIKKIKVGYNGVTVPVKNFQQYIDLYIGPKETSKRVYEQPDDRWEYAVAISPTHEFVQISFVNGISTSKGGKHVDYITGQIVRKLCDYIEKKKKIKVNASAIKEQLILFLRCDVENPSFDSQTKDFMNTPSAKFGSSCTVSDGFIEKVAKMGVMDVAMSLTEAKENKLAKKTDGSKTKSIRGIANFIDANDAGTPKSKDCILILCEGLSAMSGIVSGLSSSDRNTIGIYPLKGKLLNVRGTATKKISENKEITDIKKILGLETGKNYSTIADVNQHLRYGKIMFMTDQDLDGSHIKGLCINVFHSEWASLIKIPGFLSFMNTPILRAKKGAQTLLFYNDGEYETWKQSLHNNLAGWNIKYFKGLGTSTSAEFKEYFDSM